MNLSSDSICYTLVRHSGFTTSQKHFFRWATEVRSINGRQVPEILRAGGSVFSSYKEAVISSLGENYPDADYNGLYPRARGIFRHVSSIAEEIYIKPKEALP